MNIHKLGASQSGLAAQTGSNVKGLASASAKPAVPTGPGGPTGGENVPSNPRVASFMQHVDRRLDGIMHQDGLSDRQMRALEETKRKFDGMMRRFDHAVDDGQFDGAMGNILSQLGTAIHAILGTPEAQGTSAGRIAGNASSPSGSAEPTSTPRGIDTLA